MENAAEALKMAAAVLIFVLALSIGVNAFAEARIASQTLLDYRDREFDTTYIDSATVDTERTVGLETIVPSIYKSFDESYKVVFNNIGSEGIYQRKNETGNYDEVYYLYGTESLGLSGKSQINTFIKTILYGKNSIYLNDDEQNFIARLEKAQGIKFYDTGLYNRFKDKSFKEKSGIYYKNETEGATLSPNTNKIKIRVITYEQI